MPLETKKNYLNVCIIFAAASNLSLSFLLLILLILSGDIEKNQVLVSNYTDLSKHFKQTEDQLMNFRSLHSKCGDLEFLLGDFGHNTSIGLTDI